jgi:hypothetical protein
MEASEIKVLSFRINYNKELEVINFDKFDHYKQLSNKQGLKYSFKRPFYVAKNKFNTYMPIELMDYMIMVFTLDYDLDNVKKSFIKSLIDKTNDNITYHKYCILKSEELLLNLKKQI